MSLKIETIVDVTITTDQPILSPINIKAHMVMGVTQAFPQKIRQYATLDAVQEDFQTTDEEFKAADVFFSQVPKPPVIYIGRWVKVDTAGFLTGDAPEANLATWQAISDGAFDVDIDGVAVNVSALDFSLIASLSDVAAVIGAGTTGASVTFTGSEFVMTSDTVGASSSVDNVITPGAGTDISTLSGLDTGIATQGMFAELVEDALDAIEAENSNWYGFSFTAETRDDPDVLAAIDWAEPKIKLFFTASEDESGATSNPAVDNVLVHLNDNNINKTVGIWHFQDDGMAGNAVAGEYIDAGAAGVLFGLTDFTQEAGTITMKFKNIIGISAINPSVGQRTVLDGINANYLTLTNVPDTPIFQQGTVGSGEFIDVIYGKDALILEIQLDQFTLLVQTNKLPITADGIALQSNVLNTVLDRYRTNGFFVQSGIVTNEIPGLVPAGTFFETGYRIFPGNVNNRTAQEIADRVMPVSEFVAIIADAAHSMIIRGRLVR